MKFNFFLISILLISLISCKKKDVTEFDRTSLLENMANVIIEPAYTNLNTDLIQLNNDATIFATEPSVDNLTVLKYQFLKAYKSVQKSKMFDFGPFSDYGVKQGMNTYPTNVAKINSNIESGTYVLGALENIAAIGLPAIDYLLFNADDITIINNFTSAENALKTKSYLINITSKMRSEMAAVLEQWKNIYRPNFIAANGTDVGSSISLLFNEFLKDVELLKNAKIGIPAGQFSGGELFIDYVEAYYAKESKVLALESVKALKNMFNGGGGVGFDNYLTFLSEQNGSPDVGKMMNAQFDVCIAKIEALTTPFSSTIPTNLTEFVVAFKELKKLVAIAKTDVTAAMGVLITYTDTDGD